MKTAQYVRKEGYTVMIVEEHEPGQDEITLWHGVPAFGRYVGRWLAPSETPPEIVDEIEATRLRDKAAVEREEAAKEG